MSLMYSSIAYPPIMGLYLINCKVPYFKLYIALYNKLLSNKYVPTSYYVEHNENTQQHLNYNLTIDFGINKLVSLYRCIHV